MLLFGRNCGLAAAKYDKWVKGCHFEKLAFFNKLAFFDGHGPVAPTDGADGAGSWLYRRGEGRKLVAWCFDRAIRVR